MNDTDEGDTKLAALVERRGVLLRALGLAAAAAALSACKHVGGGVGVSTYPVDRNDRGGDDDGGGMGDAD